MRPVADLGGNGEWRHNGTIVSYERPYFGSLLILPQLIDKQPPVLHERAGPPPEQKPIARRIHGEDEYQIRYEQGHDLGNHLIKAFRE